MPQDEPGQGPAHSKEGGQATSEPSRRIKREVVLQPREFVIDVKESDAPDPAPRPGPLQSPGPGSR